MTTRTQAALAVLTLLFTTPALAAGGAMPSLVHDIGISLLTAGLLALIFHRFHIPSIAAFLVAGIIAVIIAGIAVWLQLVMVLFGPQNLRFPLLTVEWPEEEGSKIEGKERLDLDKVDDMLEVRAKAKRANAQQPAE